MTVHVRVLMPPVNHKISNVRNPGEEISEDKDGIFLMQRIGEQQKGACEAQPPKCCWHHDLLFLFGGIPLYEKAREKGGIAEPADDLPDAPVNAQ